jgi:hypothetical protein
MAKWDRVRNEPVSVDNTKAELQQLSANAQRAEASGDRVRAEYFHHHINSELDELDGLQ